MSNNGVEHFLAVNCTLGEGVLWDWREQILCWVDIVNRCYYRYTAGMSQPEKIEVGVMVGIIGLRKKGGLVLATSGGLMTQQSPASPLVEIANPIAGHPDMRFNDGKTDRQGRFWAGSMFMKPEVDRAEGNLYRFDPDGSFYPMQANVAIPNGMGWSSDGTTMYHTDSPRHTIYAYDFDPATGNIENRRPFIATPDEDGVPDGLTVDSLGYIWSARWGGWKINCYAPNGKKELEVAVPVAQPTCCAFGGPDLDTLYITSAQENFTPEQKKAQPWAGDIFSFKPGVKGLPEPEFLG